MARKESLSEFINGDGAMNRRRRVIMAARLSVPSIIAQLSAIVMEYIDASMVGHLGADATASIALVATSTWLFFGLCSSMAAGFSVQVAHRLGAGDCDGARSVLRQALTTSLLFSLALGALGVAISGTLPSWLGGDSAIRPYASSYFMIFSMAIPVFQMSMLSSGMLRSSGNMVVPGVAGAVMCLLDVIFNFFIIFPTRDISVAGLTLTMPGAGLGVTGAALGTALAETVVTAVLMIFLICRSRELSLLHRRGSFRPTSRVLGRAWRIGSPMGLERFVTSAAQITLTVIVAPLGTIAIAANGLAVTAESLCYMPGYGIGDAASALVGQSIGAGKPALARSFGRITVVMGMTVMGILGVVMYMLAPLMIGIMTPVDSIVEMGASALRIEAFAEPMFAAAIVCYGVFVGAGDTLVPASINLGCMWAVRISLAALLAPVMGLNGVWLAMAIELSVRGAIFLLRLRGNAWMSKVEKIK